MCVCVCVCVCVCIPTGADWDCSWIDGWVSRSGQAWLSFCMSACLHIPTSLCFDQLHLPDWKMPLHLNVWMTFNLLGLPVWLSV